jgi:CheY-like chemotaxis protein
MAHIICFSDSAAVISAVRQGLSDADHALHVLPASRLSEDVRQTVRTLSPEVILLELSQALDNPHLYFFLRSDQTTRYTPIILLSGSARVERYAQILDADAYLQRPFISEQLQRTVGACLMPLQERAVAA